MITFGPVTVHLLHVQLLGTSEAIWRKLLVPSNFSLDTVHLVFQAAMGWHNAHLHSFTRGARTWGPSWPELDELEMEAEERVTLAELAEEGEQFTYLYDFGDSWRHFVEAERVLDSQTGVNLRRAFCVQGRAACPPEDCGGVNGFEDLLATLETRRQPEYGEVVDWLGDWEPLRFHPNDANQRLAKIKQARK